jgi:dTDP-4-dehydrorhamnose reductase
MKVLLLGAKGQLGWELQRTCPDNIVLETCDFPKVDFLSTSSIEKCIQASAPDCIINAAAYTAVDKCEQEKDLAFRINHQAVREIAALCLSQNISLVHISTDFVFDGTSHKPYHPADKPNPVSIYGASKLMGEKEVQSLLNDSALIIRTAWLYSSHGSNFVKSMLTLMKQKERLTVIDEQIGTPTWAFGLAQTIWTAVSKNIKGIHHWTDSGVASWYDFSVAIQEEALALGLLEREIPIDPVLSSEFPTPARRPLYSVLDKTSFWEALGFKSPHWRIQLRTMLNDNQSH